jgi:hypothetical protein
MGELENLNKMEEEQPSAPAMESMDVPEAPEPMMSAEKPLEEDSPPAESEEMESSSKPEDDLVVEDVKSIKDE